MQKSINKVLTWLRRKPYNQWKNADGISWSITKIFMGTSKLYGEPLPRILTMANELKVTKKVMEEVWHLLQFEYKIINTQTKQGTTFIKKPTKQEWKIIQARLRHNNPMSGAVLFNDPSYSGLLAENEDWNKSFPISTSQYLKHGYREDKQLEDPELEMENRLRLGKRFGRVLSKKESTFTGNYHLFLEFFFKNTCQAGGEIVCLKPDYALSAEKNAKGNRMIQLLHHHAVELTIDELQDFCKSRRVATVYFEPSMAFGFEEEDPKLTLTRLIDLRDQYEFPIILHDRYLSYKAYEIFTDIFKNRENTFFYYIAPLSRIHMKYMTVNSVLGPEKKMTALNKKYSWHKAMLSAAAGDSLLMMIQTGKLDGNEQLVETLLPQRVNLTMDLLINSGLFQEKHLRKPESGFLYIEPNEGALPRNTFDLLEGQKCKIFCRTASWSGPSSKKGIVITVSAFETEAELISELDYLINILATLLIKSAA